MADDPVIQTFMIECTELLQAMEDALLRLEAAPEDEETINALFRSAHTIKGSSGIVGFENIERFTHKVENVLEQVRSGKIKVDNELIELLLKCRDHIANLIELAEKDTPASASDRTAEEGLLRQLQSYLTSTDKQSNTKINDTAPSQLGSNSPNSLNYPHPSSEPSGSGDGVRTFLHGRDVESGNWHISLRFGEDVLRNGMDPISFINYLTRLGEIVSLTTITDAVPPAAEMDPESCYLGFEIDFKSDFDKQTIEDVFEFVREDCKICILPPRSRIEEYIQLINSLPEAPLKIGEILVRGGALTPHELEEALKIQNAEAVYPSPLEGEGQGEGCSQRKSLIGEIVVDEKMTYPPVVDAAVEKQKKQKEAQAREAKTIRVDTNKLDQLVNLVGELVIANANIIQNAQRLGDIDMIESASTLSRLIEDIRDRAMQARMVPIGESFNRFHRVIRDISREMSKDIELAVSGGETELDKNLTEKINDPLMHLVRNAADHGIEKPDVRISKGKPAKGVIRLNAFNDAGSIVIEISDDGSGLNREKIIEKAVEKGLINSEQTLSDKEIYKLIFAPGFSTAENVTNISGRGVGMDVVRKGISSLRGSIDINSQEGLGTTITLRLPLTLAIIEGLLVKIGGEYFVLTLSSVEECVDLTREDIANSHGRHLANVRGQIVPYIRLREQFMIKGSLPDIEQIVIVRVEGQRVGFVVDHVIGEHQTVLKNLGRIYKDIEGISGATILGDGTVALILDVPRLVQSAEREEVRG
ncbi:MAG: chemotaxis protein CheA [Nitrospirae bacterium]|nr:chemotaxis protein CheA [Nitrospirota bacterium]